MALELCFLPCHFDLLCLYLSWLALLLLQAITALLALVIFLV